MAIVKTYTAVLGMGLTGLSCVRYLLSKNLSVVVMDSRAEADLPQDRLREFKILEQRDNLKIITGTFDISVLSGAEEIVISPGLDPREKIFLDLKKSGMNFTGDVELFCRENVKPVIAVTGSNGKSTVCALISDMARSTGLNVALGGNFGEPVLDLVDDNIDLYVLELSSFQLETTETLQAEVAVILNITPDHMNRYDSFEDYFRVKQKIYNCCKTAIFNRDDYLTQPVDAVNAMSFHAGDPDIYCFGISCIGGEKIYATADRVLMSDAELKIHGAHNDLNILASLAVAVAMGWDLDQVGAAVNAFRGLPHRCEWVREVEGVQWYNDSKGTNTGATIAALNSLKQGVDGQIILIAGGVAKGADFSGLGLVAQKCVRLAILLGQDAEIIRQALKGTSSCIVSNLHEAVVTAMCQAEKGDAVLLSPACASFDMYANYQARGDEFKREVNDLI